MKPERNDARATMKPSPFAACLSALALLASCTFLPKGARDIRQAVWVTRYDYKTEDDVRAIIRNCARSGLDTVLFQVRGNGTVGYDSALEPWFEQFDFRSPGFDPLFVACDEARQQGVRLHAWINALPGWRGKAAPKSEWQLYHTRPDWFVVDQYHDRQALLLGDQPAYLWLNPCLPEVREHVARICAEVTRKYPVDGVHLDYVRLPDRNEVASQPAGNAARDFGYDNRTLELFREASGKSPAEDRGAWDAWRADQVTALVREVKRAVDRVRRHAVVSAAVYATPDRAREVAQDWPAWLARGFVDAVFPMAYSDDDLRFGEMIAAQRAATDKPIIVGIGVYKHEDPQQTLRQIEAVRGLGFPGFALYSYAALHGSEENSKAAPVEASLRARRREGLLPTLQGVGLDREGTRGRSR